MVWLTCAWAAVDAAWEQEKPEARKMPENCADFLHIYVNTTHRCSESCLCRKEIGKPGIQVAVR